MSDIITVRDLAMVTSDIQYAQKQGARQLASNLIEIGRLLVEAKTMVAPADWEKYIWDNFGYSTSSADNWMKLYREYGDNQESLFDSFRNSQTFGKLSYTQLLALTALPAEERAEFAESHDLENMSTRQLQQAIRERDEALKAKEEAENKAAEMVGKAESLRFNAADEADRAKKAAKDAEAARGKAEKEARDAAGQVGKLKKQLADAKKAEDTARAELKKARENPDIPESIMEQLRKEAEAGAAKKASEGLQKQLAEAEAAARAAEDKLAAEKKAGKLQNPDVMSINVLGQQMISIWNTIQGHRKKAVAAEPGCAEPIDRFLKTVLDTMAAGLNGRNVV